MGEIHPLGRRTGQFKDETFLGSVCDVVRNRPAKFQVNPLKNDVMRSDELMGRVFGGFHPPTEKEGRFGKLRKETFQGSLRYVLKTNMPFNKLVH